MSLQAKEIKKIEVDILLMAIKRRYGYDFTEYSKASLIRRLDRRRISSNLNYISELIPRLLYDETELDEFICELSVTVTEMFRDPDVFLAIKKKVFPTLETYPRIKIWHAGCATGEEVYSMAIMLKEAGLYDRVQIYATDFNNKSLEIARKGIYSCQNMKIFTSNYQRSDGESSFANYYHAKYNNIIMSESLKKNIVFSNHNLVHDGVFGEMHLVLCRNVLIYFNKELQQKVFSLFDECIASQGFICLGLKESLKFSVSADNYELISEDEKIYRKKIIW